MALSINVFSSIILSDDYYLPIMKSSYPSSLISKQNYYFMATNDQPG